jgi:hypothetical protein
MDYEFGEIEHKFEVDGTQYVARVAVDSEKRVYCVVISEYKEKRGGFEPNVHVETTGIGLWDLPDTPNVRAIFERRVVTVAEKFAAQVRAAGEEVVVNDRWKMTNG